MPSPKSRQPVPGTTIFDGEQARKGYALNKMCYSFNDAANRKAFVADEDGYCAKYGLRVGLEKASTISIPCETPGEQADVGDGYPGFC